MVVVEPHAFAAVVHGVESREAYDVPDTRVGEAWGRLQKPEVCLCVCVCILPGCEAVGRSARSRGIVVLSWLRRSLPETLYTHTHTHTHSHAHHGHASRHKGYCAR